MPGVLLLQEHLLFYLLLVELLGRRQIEVVDDVRDVGDTVLLRRSSSSARMRRLAAALVRHILRLASRLPLVEAVVVHVLHARQRVLLLIVRRDVRRPCLIEATGALESLVIGPLLLWVRCLPLARTMLQQLVLVSEADQVVLIRLLRVLADVALRSPRIDERLLVVGRLLLGVRGLAVAAAMCFRLAGNVLELPISVVLSVILVTEVVAGPLKVGGFLLPLLDQVRALLLPRTASLLAARRVVLHVGALDLSLVGCGPLLLRLPLSRMVPLLAAALLLVEQLYLFLLLICLLLFLQLLLEHLLLLVLKLPLPFLPVEDGVAHHFGPEEVHRVVAHEVLDCLPAVLDLAELNEERDQVEQLLVLRVVVPRHDGNGLLGLKHVRRRRVVEDDCVLGGPANLAHVFGEDSLHVGAVLTKQAGGAVPVGVHLVHERIGVLRQTRGEDDHLEVLCHHPKEVVHARPLLHEDLARVAVDVDRNNEVWVLDLVELAVDQGLI